jgi:flagellar biosynthesis protein FliR
LQQALQQIDPTGLLPRVAGAHLVAFVLVIARVGPLFLLAPVFSARMIPARAKLIAAGAIAVALTPLAEHGQKLPSDVLGVGGLVLKEALVGVAFAFVLAAIGAAVQAGASLLDTLIGFSFASLVDPITNMSNAILGQVYALFTALVFVVTGGDHIMIMGLAKSYELVPLSAAPDPGQLGATGFAALASVFTIGLEIAAPAVIALVVADAAFAIVARAVPQMNVFIVGLPAKILLGFATVAASLPYVSMHVQDDLANAVMTALHGLSGK